MKDMVEKQVLISWLGEASGVRSREAVVCEALQHLSLAGRTGVEQVGFYLNFEVFPGCHVVAKEKAEG